MAIPLCDPRQDTLRDGPMLVMCPRTAVKGRPTPRARVRRLCRDAAVVEPVGARPHAVEVEENTQVILLRPIYSLVEVAKLVGEARTEFSVAKEPIAIRNPNHLEPSLPNRRKRALVHPLRKVRLQPRACLGGPKSLAKRGLVDDGRLALRAAGRGAERKVEEAPVRDGEATMNAVSVQDEALFAPRQHERTQSQSEMKHV